LNLCVPHFSDTDSPGCCSGLTYILNRHAIMYVFTCAHSRDSSVGNLGALKGPPSRQACTFRSAPATSDSHGTICHAVQRSAVMISSLVASGGSPSSFVSSSSAMLLLVQKTSVRNCGGRQLMQWQGEVPAPSVLLSYMRGWLPVPFSVRKWQN
jgi:hypothetical protein